MSGDLDEYCSQHTTDEPALLKTLTRDTFTKVLNPRMLSGHVQGRVLKMLVAMIRPKQILEIGTFTGYSALCMAEGADPDTVLHTIEINDEVARFAQSFFDASNSSARIKLHVGDAKEVLGTLGGTFDLVFIDGDKREYTRYYEACLPRVAIGGYIVADNVLWDGHVLDENVKKNDMQTLGIVEFNNRVQADSRVENVMLPLRDGLLIIRKIAEGGF